MSLIIARSLSRIPARLFYTSAVRLVDEDGKEFISRYYKAVHLNLYT